MNKNNLLIIFLLIIISVPSIYSLIHSGFFVSDDGEWMVIRFSAFYQALRDGQFPVRFLGRLNNGYGYPVANFLYPGFMYLGIPIHVLGFNFVDTIKIVLGISMVGSAIFVYLWLSKLFDKISSFVGAVIYIYLPYHLIDLYKRGSVGEILALAIPPFIFWQLERKSLFFVSLGIAFLILSHNTLALLFLPVIFVYMLLDIFIAKEKRELTFRYALMLFLSLGLSAFFWMPAVFELQYTVFSKTSVSKFNEYFANLNLIGFSTLIIFLLVFTFFITKKIKIHKHRLTLLLFIIGILSLFFATQYSSFLWNILPASFIQFPFRLLSVVILCISFLSAVILSVLKNKTKVIVGIILVALTVVSSWAFIKPNEFFNKEEGFYATNEGTTTVQDEYLPKWVSQKPTEHFKEKVELTNNQSQISNLAYNSKHISFDINAQTDTKVKINTIYYPGWKATINGVQSNIQYQNSQGVMELSVPKGNYKINLSFSETPLRLFADTLSIISSVILIICVLWLSFPRKRESRA